MQNPYDDLYIYYLQGRLNPFGLVFGNDYIGCWQEDTFSFLFFSKPARSKIAKILSLNPGLSLLDEFQMTYEQWQGGKITPFKVGRFYITPPWHARTMGRESNPNALPIVLDPGVVFGTGTHPTTHNCLEALEFVFNIEKPGSTLDLGTGSGLLAIAASLLGCPQTLAVDLNFLATSTTLQNIKLNRLQDSVMVVQGKAEDFIDSNSDLVIANIHYDVMKHLITAQGFLSKKWFILSGLLRTQVRNITDTMSRLPIQIIKKWEQDGIWHTFCGRILKE